MIKANQSGAFMVMQTTDGAVELSGGGVFMM